MSEITDKVAELEATEAKIKQKQEELEKSNLEVDDKTKQKAALDAEVARVQKEIVDAKELRRNGEMSFQEKLQTENLESAAKKVFEELGIDKPEDQAQFLESFKKTKPDAITVDSLSKAMRTKYAAEHADELIASRNREKELESGAADFSADASSSGAMGARLAAPTAGNDSLDADDIAAARWAGIPLEKYKELKKKGLLD